MASSSFYQDPGVSSQEVLVPTGLNIPSLPFAEVLIGTGSRNKRVNNEKVLRGVVTDEALTVGASAGSHTATLAHRADRKIENTTVTKTLNSIDTEVLDSQVSFDAAYVLGTVTSTANLSSNNAIGLEMDGIEPVTIVVHDVPAALTNNLVFTFSTPTVTLARASGSFLTDGVRPGATVTLATSEDAGNDGSFTVLTVSALNITFANASGVANADDDTSSVTFSGTGFVGREIHTFYNVAAAATVSMTEAAAAINQALAASTDLGYGSSYSAVASVSSSALKITSIISTSTSDVRVSSPITADGTTALFGAPATGNRDAVTGIRITNAVYNASATYTATYAQISDDTDPLENTGLSTVVSVGSSKGGTNFNQTTDWLLTSDEIDWSPDTAATLTGVAGTFNIATNDRFILQIDGLTGTITNSDQILIDLVGMTPAPLGYAAPSSAAAATATEVVANINAILAAELGPRYKAVASVSGTKVVLTSPLSGRSQSAIEVVANSTLPAHTAIFGGEVQAYGTGKRPVAGSTYFVTYEYTRPDSDYNVPFRHFSVDAALLQVGNPSISTAGYNPLGLAAQLAFENGAPFIYTIQVDDSTAEGNPTRAQILEGLEGAKTIFGGTEIVVVGEPGTRLVIKTDMVDHLEDQNSSLEKHPRRIWCGMSSGTAIGSRDDTDSIVGCATRTLQVSASSPGRGRMFLVAPPQLDGMTRDVTFEDGTTARLDMDGTYLAVAVAARRTSLSNAFDTLTSRTITGFNIDDVTAAWKPGERRTMAGQGVLVITLDGGRLKMLEALSTEGGGGGKASFRVDSTSYQKDIVNTKVNQALDANIIGIVPFDLANFLIDVRLIISGVIAQEVNKSIGSFRDKSGAVRAIDPRTDIRVALDPDDPTQFTYDYWYMLRYPMLRGDGRYSVDNPFFSGENTGT